MIITRNKVLKKNISIGGKIFIDMDNCMVDFKTAIPKLSKDILDQYPYEDLDDVPGIFSKMDPMPGAVEVIKALSKKYDLYVLSTAPWKNSTAWSDKIKWIQKYFGAGKDSIFYKKVILSHNKQFEVHDGAYLIDDRPAKNGSDVWDKAGKLINFGNSQFPDWYSIGKFLL